MQVKIFKTTKKIHKNTQYFPPANSHCTFVIEIYLSNRNLNYTSVVKISYEKFESLLFGATMMVHNLLVNKSKECA